MPGASPSIEEWGAERAGALAALMAAACPGEDLSSDELLACCWDDPGVVLGLDGGEGAVAAVVRSFGDHRVGHFKLLAVEPDARRGGLGRALLAAAESWLFDHGAAEVQFAGAAPFYLWPGIDVRQLGLLCLVEAAGYDPMGSELNMTMPTTFRSEPPTGITTRRVLDDDDVVAVSAFVDRFWPWWADELGRSIEHGTCHAAVTDEATAIVGFACHSVNRAGWIGPMGTDPERGRAGVGHALLGALCRDLMIADFDRAEIAWVGPVRFYAKAGAEVSTVFRTYRRARP